MAGFRQASDYMREINASTYSRNRRASTEATAHYAAGYAQAMADLVTFGTAPELLLAMTADLHLAREALEEISACDYSVERGNKPTELAERALDRLNLHVDLQAKSD